MRKARSVAGADGGSSVDEFVSRGDAGGGAAAAIADRFYALFPQRGGILWQRRARDYPAAPVSESGAGEIRPSRRFLRTVRKADARCRSSAAAARIASSRG